MVLEPPFRAQYADLVLDVPDRPDLYQARGYSFGLSMRICHRAHLKQAPAECENLTGPIVNQYGVQTFVTSPCPGRRFELLKERPSLAPTPPSAALTPVFEALIDRNILDAEGEAYELSRISTLDPQAPLLTTTNGWPLARCDKGLGGRRYCTIGFLIRNAFVEARVYSEDGVVLDQRQIWDVASALDAKLRALSPPPATRIP